jgi:hypothetical protein
MNQSKPLIFTIQLINGQTAIIDYTDILHVTSVTDAELPQLKSIITLRNGQTLKTTMTVEQYSHYLNTYFFPELAAEQMKRQQEEAAKNAAALQNVKAIEPVKLADGSILAPNPHLAH